MRTLAIEILLDPALAADFAERLDKPLKELKRRRLHSAQRAGQLASDADLDLAVDMIWGPLRSRWLNLDGPLTIEFADAVIQTALNGLRPRTQQTTPV